MVPDIRELDAEEARHWRHDLAELLVDAVDHGASVSFLHPLSVAEALAYWETVIDKLARRDLFLLCAFSKDGQLLGTTQLHVRTPPNQPHRADVAKVIVHSRARRQGLGRLLMQEVECLALRKGKTLLVLDTVCDSPAEQLYRSLGYSLAGVIPGYALLPDGRPAGTSIFYKHLSW